MANSKIVVAMLGAGNMGTALSNIIANNGFQVKLWNYEGDIEPLTQIKDSQENKKYLPGIKLSANIIPEQDLEAALKNSEVIFFSLPSNCIGSLVKKSSLYLKKGAICVDVSKGLDETTLEVVPKMMEKYLPTHCRQNVIDISGPAIATDMARGAFTAMNIAGKNPQAIKTVQKILNNDQLRLVPNSDLIGVEIAGSLKNVYAIAIGLCDFYKWPMNTKAAILVCALKEIAILTKKMGGKEKTVYDLAGLGDLVGTALSEHSRNRRFGACLPKHLDKDSAAKEIGQVVEGINASKIALHLSKKYKVGLPLSKAIYEIVYKKASPDITLKKFLKNIK
jgi:glycerol-3-phosphate dehydrogenase (NAD(P)+)